MSLSTKHAVIQLIDGFLTSFRRSIMAELYFRQRWMSLRQVAPGKPLITNRRTPAGSGECLSSSVPAMCPAIEARGYIAHDSEKYATSLLRTARTCASTIPFQNAVPGTVGKKRHHTSRASSRCPAAPLPRRANPLALKGTAHVPLCLPAPWDCCCSAPRPGRGMTDAEFFAAMDLARPELAAVRAGGREAGLARRAQGVRGAVPHAQKALLVHRAAREAQAAGPAPQHRAAPTSCLRTSGSGARTGSTWGRTSTGRRTR